MMTLRVAVIAVVVGLSGLAACTTATPPPIPDGGAGAGGIGGQGGGGQGGTTLRWFRTCGDPVCRVDEDGGAPDSGVPTCAGKEGDACDVDGATCDPGIGCNVKFKCASKSPIVGGCPISRRAAKQDIRYLDDAAIERLAAELQALRLATYRYRAEPSRERLGFILDDAPGSFAVDEPRDQVDLYGYLSLAVAALQSQGKRIEAQEREIADLKSALTRGQRRGIRVLPHTRP